MTTGLSSTNPGVERSGTVHAIESNGYLSVSVVAEPIFESADARLTNRPADSARLTVSDRTVHMDRFMQVLSDRRRRFCLYYLHRANEPVSIRDLAALVETSITPSEASLDDRLRKEAVQRLEETHLPKLRDLGLVRTSGGYAELAADLAIPVEDWLTTTARFELAPSETGWVSENPPTHD